MKKIKCLLAVVVTLSGSVFAQDKKNADPSEYMRSSLYTIILDDKGLMDPDKAEIIKTTFFEAPLPEKFNDHNLSEYYRSFDPSMFSVTEDELNAVLGANGDDKSKKKKGGGFGSALAGIGKTVGVGATAGLADASDTKQLPAIFVKYFEENNIANKIVGKWYNQSDVYDGTSFFNMDLIKERGLYNATEFDKGVADRSARGLSMLADAGENLIKNTFVVGVRFNYVNKEDIAKELAAASNAITGILGGSAAALANSAIQAGAAVAGKGYVIRATAFLYQLEWTEEISTTFYMDYYGAEDLSNFETSKNFKLKYIGSASEWSDIQSTVFSKKTEEELVQRAAIRSVDEVIGKLQKRFEVFRTKTPILTVEPEITAQIGLKEGLTAGDKFEVLEKMKDPETDIVTYKRIDVIRVEKGKIWDNRYAADEERAEMGEDATVNATYFRGGNKNKLYPGLLIRQID